MRQLAKFSVLGVALIILILGKNSYADKRTPTWDGWDFMITDVRAEGLKLFVQFCNRSGKGKDGHVNITCNIQGQDYVQSGVYCKSGDCKRVRFEVPSSIFKGVMGDEWEISKKITGQKAPIPQTRTLKVPISIKGGPLGAHQFYYTIRTLRFEK